MRTISPELLKRTLLTATLTATLGMGVAFAQIASTTDSTVKPDGAETNTMDHYLNNHPEEAKELHANPSLINDPKWLAEHPKVQTYMARHPGLKSDAASRPNEFVNHTERQDLARDHKGLNNVDNYARQHPEVANELKNNPKLIDDPKYLAQHPGLDKYLEKHPEAREAAMRHPDEFAHAAEANEKYDKNHQQRNLSKPPKASVAKRK